MSMGLWIKRIFIAVTTLIVVAVCALFVFILSFNADAYKSDLQLLVKERTNRELTIAGELNVELFPKLAIRVRQVSLSEPGLADRFVLIDDLRASMAIWPLLKNQIVIDELRASGIQVNLVRARDGKLNIDDLLRWLAGEGSPGDMPDVILATDAMTIDVAGIQFKDADMTLRDERSQSVWKITGLSLSTGRVAHDTPVDVNLEATIRGAGMPGGAKVTAKAMATVDLQARQLDARDLVVVAKGDWSGAGWLPEPMAGLDVVVRSPEVSFGSDAARLTFDRFSVRAKGQWAGNPLEFSLDAPGLEIASEKVVAAMFESRLRVEGTPGLDVAWVGKELTGSAQAWALARLDCTLSVNQESRTMRSFVSSPVQVLMEPLSITFADLRGDVNVTPKDPKLAQRRMVIKGNLAVSDSGKAGDPRPLSLRGRFESIPFGLAWTGMNTESPLDGMANLDLDLKAADGSWAKAQDSVAGTVQLKIEDAAIRGIDFAQGLDALRTIAKPSAEGGRFIGDPAKHTEFDNVEIGLRVEGKMASITKLDMDGYNWRVTLGKPAELNLRDGTTNLGVILHLLGPQRITAGKVSVEVRSLVVPLRLTGALNNPHVNIDWPDLERDRLGKALRQKLLDWDGKLGEASGKARARQN